MFYILDRIETEKDGIIFICNRLYDISWMHFFKKGINHSVNHIMHNMCI
jgi:hypothetical protein